MGFTTDLSAGAGWFDRLAAEFDFAAAYRLTRHRLAELARGFELDEQDERARAGPILAAGSTDIYDLESRLHRRTAIGPTRMADRHDQSRQTHDRALVGQQGGKVDTGPAPLVSIGIPGTTRRASSKPPCGRPVRRIIPMSG